MRNEPIEKALSDIRFQSIARIDDTRAMLEEIAREAVDAEARALVEDLEKFVSQAEAQGLSTVPVDRIVNTLLDLLTL